MLYLAKLEKHKCRDHWNCMGQELKDVKRPYNIKKVWTVCGICGKFEAIKYRKGMKIKGMEGYRWHQHLS